MKSGNASLDQQKLLAALIAVRDGDFTVRMPLGATGLPGRIHDAFNEVVGLNQRLCKELSRITFSDVGVMAEAARFIAVKVDATNEDDDAVDKVKNRYGVVGLPTVVLLGSDGVERARFTEFVPPERFLDAIREIN